MPTFGVIFGADGVSELCSGFIVEAKSIMIFYQIIFMFIKSTRNQQSVGTHLVKVYNKFS